MQLITPPALDADDPCSRLHDDPDEIEWDTPAIRRQFHLGTSLIVAGSILPSLSLLGWGLWRLIQLAAHAL